MEKLDSNLERMLVHKTKNEKLSVLVNLQEPPERNIPKFETYAKRKKLNYEIVSYLGGIAVVETTKETIKDISRLDYVQTIELSRYNTSKKD